MRNYRKNMFVLFSAFISIVLLIVARHHPPSRRKIKEIWHGRVFWEGNTTRLRSGPCVPDTRFKKLEWYNEYAKKVRMVQPFPTCKTCISSEKDSDFTMIDACARWWHSTPQRLYRDLPRREWSGILRPKKDILPKCSFGQKIVSKNKCFEPQQKLFDALDKLRVIYFARCGTELGIVRQSAYISEDGDIDIYVDMPQKMFFEKLSKEISPAPEMYIFGRIAEVAWKTPGCPEIHFVYNDWISEELQHRATHDDLCLCGMNSVQLICHKDAPKRMYTQYGPSWEIPLGIKMMEHPMWMFTHKNHTWSKQTMHKLKTLKTSEFIETLPGVNNNSLALAQLNVILSNIV